MELNDSNHANRLCAACCRGVLTRKKSAPSEDVARKARMLGLVADDGRDSTRREAYSFIPVIEALTAAGSRCGQRPLSTCDRKSPTIRLYSSAPRC
ncbi:hypothetical protein [Bradyrhizobium elkanii]|uniref:hypothetical protein n=1 Tax=Bradyrhizobium elkanii TaxID=29448 RepID=UPI0027153E1F|nr:hypothetical protein [Bradyrhizobium elkanii]WLC11634.1 hypothetical protein QIH86_20390 [Bradyrhizobium elkanii USDA 94]